VAELGGEKAVDGESCFDAHRCDSMDAGGRMLVAASRPGVGNFCAPRRGGWVASGAVPGGGDLWTWLG
jgi:hypothetical protein